MGKFNLIAIRTTETEVAFMQRYIGALCALDDRLVCNTTVDAEYDMSDTSHTPTFDFTIADHLTFRIQRAANLATGSYGYIFSAPGTSYSVTSYVNGEDATSATPLSVKGREINFAYIIADNLISIGLTCAMQYSNSNLNVVYIKDSDSYYTSIRTDILWASNSAWRKQDIFNICNPYSSSVQPVARQYTKNGDTIPLTFVSRFQYASAPGKIDYVKNCVFQNNGTKLFNVTTVYDCTTVPVGECVSLDDGAYLAVGPHQLVRMIASS